MVVSKQDLNELEYRCEVCGKICNIVEEVFDYSGTHCTNGESGTHHTGHYNSDCCGGEYVGIV